MNRIFTLTTYETYIGAIESILNAFRIGLNDWDKSKVFEVQGCRMLTYTIVTDEETFNNIVNRINGI